MQTVKTSQSVKNHNKPRTMQKRIGSITYEVEIRFNPKAKETLNEKILRLIKNDMEAAS